MASYTLVNRNDVYFCLCEKFEIANYPGNSLINKIELEHLTLVNYKISVYAFTLSVHVLHVSGKQAAI